MDDQQEAAAIFAEAVQERARAKGERATPKVQDLSEELKEVACLDQFPEHIQRQILELSQSMADYLVQIGQPEEETGKLPFGRRLINAWGDVPSRDIWKDANKNAWKAFRMAPKGMKTVSALAAHAGTTLGATGGWIYGSLHR